MSEREVTEPAEILLALPGDVILCWDCGAEVALITDGRHPIELEILPAGRQVDELAGRLLFCRHCGGNSGVRSSTGRKGRAQDDPAARMLVRSGSWTGWRALGGE